MKGNVGKQQFEAKSSHEQIKKLKLKNFIMTIIGCF